MKFYFCSNFYDNAMLVSYMYDGSGSPMQTVYNQSNISSTYIDGGLDRYGRIINHSWFKNNNPLVHIIHSYDYASNRTKRHDSVHAANSELYNYDNLGQIKSLNRGELNSAQNAVTTANHSESWNFDKTGNWSQYTKNGTVENRTHNAANELQGIATHDANGNMILMPGLKGKYDAWNRLVEVRDTNDNLIAVYEYNGLNQRIKKTVNGVVTKSFFNENWQELESQTGTQVISYIWGLRYIDDLVLREKGTEILYSLADPNWNVVALIDSTGSVVERMKYDAFGKITWLDNNFTAKNGSDYNWNRTFTGQVLDNESGLILYRNRYYSTNFGRFISRDPIEFGGEDVNLFRYVSNVPSTKTDELGLKGGDRLDAFLSEVISFLGQGFVGTKQCFNIPGSIVGPIQVVGTVCGNFDISRCCINGRHKICTVIQVEGAIGGYATGSRGLGSGYNPPLGNWKKPIILRKIPQIPSNPVNVSKIPNVPFRHGYRNACPSEGSSGEFCVTASVGFAGWSFGGKRCYNFKSGTWRTETGMGVGQGTGVSGGLSYTNTSCFWE